MVAFESFGISAINYNKKGISLNTVSLSQPQILISKNKNGEWEHDKWRIKSLADDDQTDNEPAEKEKKASTFSLALNKLNIKTSEKIRFIDNSTRPAMLLGIRKLDVDLRDLNSDKPDNNSQFKVFAKTLRHGTLELVGSIKPFAKKISVDAEGQLKGFDLRAATPATKKSIGHIIKSGQLDADLKLLAVNGILDSNVSLSLYQFHIQALNNLNAKELDKKFGMPLNKTLILLRNKDGSIHLDIPISGDVNNPDFQPMDAIIKATTKAATVTLITFYTPYGLAYAGGNLMFDLATALNFDPVQFAAGSTELTEQLNKLAILLTEKPQIHLTLCGNSNVQDAYILFPELKPDTENAPVPELNIEQIKKLKTLSKQRQIRSKQYLVSEKAIEHNRLILCAPEYERDKDAIAGVEIII